MHWSEINPALIALFTELAVDQVKTVAEPGGKPYHDALQTPEWSAQWRERPGASEFIHPQQALALFLKVTSCVGVGGDEFRYEEQTIDVADGEPVTDLVETICGLRRFVLQVQAWSLEETDAQSAMNTLERLRTRLNRQSSYDRMLAVNVDITDCGPTANMTATYEKRRWSIASMDVTFTAAINDVDPVPVGWIERIVLSSDIEGIAAPKSNMQSELSPGLESSSRARVP